MSELLCDPETGECNPTTVDKASSDIEVIKAGIEVIYIGDPMCSWCWGISPALKSLRDHYAKENISFKIVVGGLRPGGGDPWNDQMKEMLAHHWQQVNKRSGQPFGYALMDLEDFNYDTEPACRAAVASRSLVEGAELEFFDAVQRKFYVESQDPGNIEFYQSICELLNIDFDVFKTNFESDTIKTLTQQEFSLNRQWGVRGYPTVVLRTNEELHMVTHGFSTFEKMKNRIE